MPGLAGFTSGGMDTTESRQVAMRMRDLMTHHANYVNDAVFCSGCVCATRCHTDVLQKERQPFVKHGVAVWMDGEFYNRSEVAKELDIEADTDPQLLLALYERKRDLSLLRRVDGIFAAAIYDAQHHEIHLITDRYAFRQLYWTDANGRLTWSSEVKAMLGLPWFSAKVDTRALSHFLGIGHFIFDRTWLDGVRQLMPASVLTWDLRSRRPRIRRYWWWDEIEPLSGQLDKGELAEELGRRFAAGVRRRMPDGERIGIELSGGLDSRAIFAAMPERNDPIHAVTVGGKDCDEAHVAAAVVGLKPNTIHHTFEINAKNWLLPRIEAVWQTDGCLNLRHMHNICLRGKVKDYYDVYFHGAGGGIVGGESLFAPTTEAYLASLREKYHRHPELLTPEFVQTNEQDLVEYFQSLGSAHALYADWMVRSFTIHYTRTNRVDGVECRVPIFDKRFQELLFAIPLEKRFDRWLEKPDALYKTMLLRTFPAYYKRIPYQNTGIPISWPDPNGRVSRLACYLRRTKNKIHKEVQARLGRRYESRTQYADYDHWIRQEPARSFFTKVLLSPSALCAEYIPRQQVRETWRQHLAGARHAEVLCRYLTLELWLQQVFEGQYRRSPEPGTAELAFQTGQQVGDNVYDPCSSVARVSLAPAWESKRGTAHEG